MIEYFFTLLATIEDNLWGFIGVPMLMLLGLYLTFQSNFFQIRRLPHIIYMFFSYLRVREHGERGIHPLKAFFACVGGCVGVGNIVGICTAVQIGGPGALLWIWITAIAGMIVKYAEVYLGIRYRVPNNDGGYNGGPMYYLQRVFKGSWAPKLVAILLCVYGVEVYQFSVITESLTSNLHLNEYAVIAGLLALVILAASGGVRRVGAISSAIIPFFVVLYIGMGLWVLMNHLQDIPVMIGEVLSSSFTGSAAFGGFVGSTLMLTISQGVRRGCYTGDVGVGYASIIHSESLVKVPQEQAGLVIFDIFLDTFVICTTSVMLILVTGIWHQPMEAGMMVQTALGQYFPYMNFFMPLFLFLLGYSTINAYFCVGLKCADFLSPAHGRKVFYPFAVLSLLTFSFVGTAEAQSVMSITNVLLLIINCYGIYKLRREVSYSIETEPTETRQPELA